MLLSSNQRVHLVFHALVAPIEHLAVMGNSVSSSDNTTTRVDLFYTRWCGYCRAARRTLESRSIPFRLHDLTSSPREVQALKSRTGHPTMPQIFLDDELLGGFDEFRVLLQEKGPEHFRPN